MSAVIVSRAFTELDEGREAEQSWPLEHYFGHAAVVVLGEPGMGKTNAFESAARKEANAVYISVRQFLRARIGQWAGKTLYLDGLDESRARTGGGAGGIDNLVRRLGEADAPRFRLSCRPADWEGSSDATALKDASADNQLTVLRLEPLTDDDVLAISADRVRDPNAFLNQAKVRGLETLLYNPQTLGMLLEVVPGGQWPETRRELFEEACRRLLSEHNPEHARVGARAVPLHDLSRAAGYLAAVYLLSDIEGFALTTAVARSDYPALQYLRDPTVHLDAAARTRMFGSAGPEVVVPPHRTITEFMAASYLSQRISEGLPVGRVLALMTGLDGGTTSHLRGVYAWLVSLCAEHTTELLRIDPLAAVLYGDASGWPASTKQLALRALRRVGETDPYFRAGQWAGLPFGALADHGLADDLVDMLTASRHDNHQLGTALDIAHYGRPLPELGDALLALVKDDQTYDPLRAGGIAAFAHCCPDRLTELLDLLEQVHGGEIADRDKVLRAALLKLLYPTLLSPSDIVHYLIPAGRERHTEYAWFQMHHLPRSTPRERLPELADALAAEGAPEDPTSQLSWSTLLGAVLHRILTELEPVEPACLYRWLAGCRTNYGRQVLRDEHRTELVSYLSARPELYKALFAHWLVTAECHEPGRNWWEFEETLCKPTPPPDFGIWLLHQIEDHSDTGRVDGLFDLTCSILLAGPLTLGDPLDLLFDFAHRHPQHAAALERRCAHPLRPSYFDDIIRWKGLDRNNENDLAERRQSWIDGANGTLEKIRNGVPTDVLAHFAGVWFGRFGHVDRSASPIQRLVHDSTVEIAEALQAGFVEFLYRNEDFFSPSKIAELYLNEMRPGVSYILLAGMDIVAERSQRELLELPDSVLRAGFCLELVVPTEQTREWPRWVRRQKSELAAQALEAFWQPLIEAKSEDVPGLDDLPGVEGFPTVCVLLTALLNRVRDPTPATLQSLLAALLRHCDTATSRRLVNDVLGEGRADLSSLAQLYWTTVAFLVEPSENEEALTGLVEDDSNRARELYIFLNLAWEPEERQSDCRVLEPLIALLGSTHDNVPDSWESGPVDNTDAEHLARFVRRLIDRLRYDPNVDAGKSFERLLSNVKLAAWQDHLKHAFAAYTRSRREALFRYANVQEVVDVLAHEGPANGADLQAIVVDHLRDLARHYRDGATDGWKVFWNTDKHGKATDAKIENQCRDRLLEDLKPKLNRHAVVADREGSFAEDKRSDIKITAAGSMVLPLEIKRHSHSDLWTALGGQLQRLYTRDPETGGRGIYLVLWFGVGKDMHLPTPPHGIDRPTNAKELEERLRETIPVPDRFLTEVIVIDCAIPV